MRHLALLLVTLSLCAPIAASAKKKDTFDNPSRSRSSSSWSHRSSSISTKSYHLSATHAPLRSYHAPRASRSLSSSRTALGVKRDSHGRIARNPKARREFKQSHPCPSTGKRSGACPGYVIDHVRALKHGGADTPSNMQWQTKAAAKAKDKWE